MPSKGDDPHWDEQLSIGRNWQQRAQRSPRELQLQLLQASNTARFPHAYLFRALLLQEMKTKNVPWQEVWDQCLRREMMSGREITFQTCLNLRLLVSKGNEQKRQEIASELQTMLTGQIKMQNLIFNYIVSIKVLECLDLRDLRDLRDNIDYDFVILEAIGVLKDGINSSSLAALFCLYSIIATNDTVASRYSQHIQDSLQRFIGSIPTQQALEQRLLAEAVLRVLEPTSVGLNTSPSLSTPAYDRALRINELQQHTSLSKQDAVELLSACTDTRKVSEEAWQRLHASDFYFSTETVGTVAWSLLSQPWSVDAEAEIFVVPALDDKNALVCAAAARLLQQVKVLEAGERRRAAEKIVAILRDDKLSRRPLDPPGGRIERLDDLLFETLRVLVE